MAGEAVEIATLQYINSDGWPGPRYDTFMPPRRAIGAVLHNFLGTYTSRYSDYRGYWLFGLMLEKLDRLEIDLLAASPALTEPLFVFAVDLAVAKFAQQLALAGFGRSSLREARLAITKVPGSVQGQVNGHTRTGYMVRFAAQAISDQGKSYGHEKLIFVAPHSFWVEWRRANW